MVRMPLKLRVGKRSGAYELARDVFVVTIRLLEEGASVQCTLGTASPGADVLDFLALRLQLPQVHLSAEPERSCFLAIREGVPHDEQRRVNFQSLLDLWK